MGNRHFISNRSFVLPALFLLATSLVGTGRLLAAPGPDLSPTALDAAAVSTDGQSLVVSGALGAEVRNLGDADVVNNFSVLAFEDQNGNASFDSGVDAVLGNLTHSNGLAAGATVNLSIAVSGTVSFKGNIIYVLVDSGGAIAEADETNNLRHTGQSSQFIPPTGMFSPVLEWSWTSSTVEPNALNVMMTPSIIDLNNDQVPDVVFGSTPSTGGARVEVGFLRALNGADGSELFTVNDPGLRVNTASSIAVGDIDLDGRPEIVACDTSGARLIVFEHDGTFKWRSPVLESINWGAPAIADMDGDGTPEIIVGRQVLDNTGTVLWTGTAGRGAPASTGPLSLVADIDLNGSPDLVAGNTVYRADGTILWQAPITDGYNAVANFDADPSAEIVLVSGGTVRLLDQDGSVIWGPVAIPGGGLGGPPTIADYDSDGEPEIGVAGASRYAVFESDGTLKWSVVTQDRSSNRTGSSVFDFDGDGSAEVVYRDELYLRVYRGSDGGVLFQTPMSSCTWYEYVLVADVDADGNAEIVAVANNNCGYGPQRGVFVFGDANDNWVATRQIWNQHTYHITNINADGSIPAVEQNNWQIAGLNNYRLNEFLPGEGASTDAPDLIPSFIRQDLSNCPVSVDITARVGNGGALAAPSGTNVSIYQGDPSAGGVLLGVVPTTRSLAPGEFEDVTVTWNGPATGLQDIFVVADDDGTGAGAVNEGNEDNNTHETRVAICTVLEPAVTNVACRAKDSKIDVTWDALNGALSYRVLRHVSGDSVLAGEVEYTVFADFGLSNGTTYTYTVRGVLAGGEETADSAPCSATPLPRSRNRRPVITSTPDLTATQDQLYSYDVEASDPEGAALTYSLAFTPQGVSIDAVTGLLQWTPDNTAVGDHVLTVVAQDPGGQTASQSWQLSVADVNDPPGITSIPVTTATAGVLYSYDVEASDPEGDPLTFALDTAPAGMSTAPATGVINWTPTVAQVGPQAVTVRVGDGKGGFATQSYTVTVSLPANSPPSITSTPLLSATEGQSYSYDVEATDPDAGDVLTFSLDTAPAGMSIDTASGLIQWTPANAQLGANAVTVRVADDSGGFATQSFTINVAAVPNEPPSITSTPLLSATEGQPYSYDVEATDPDAGDVLTFSLDTAPAGMSIDTASGLIQWTPANAQLGANAVTVRVADDSGGFATQSFTLTVAAEVQPISIDVQLTPEIADPGQVVTITVLATGAVTPAITVTQDGSDLPLDSSNTTTFSATDPGIYPLQVTVVDNNDGRSETTTAFVRVRDAGDTSPPSVSITAPVDGDHLLVLSNVIGSVTDANLFRYQLLLAPGGTNEFSEFATGDTAVVNASLGALDPGMLSNGLYRLLVIAEDINGLQAQDFVDIQVAGELKPGVVQLSFTDMVVPVAGIPITVVRNYDSRVKTGRDLGIGWSLSIRQGSYTNNREPGLGWNVVSGGGFLNPPCTSAVELLHHVTEVRLSDTEAYEFRITPQFFGFGSLISGGCLGQVSFTQTDGIPGATLVPLESTSVFFQSGSGLLTYDLGDTRFGDPWEPGKVRLRTPDGREADFDINTGVTRIDDSSGNQLFISSSGVVNASGSGVQFVRDGQGRITQIIDPLNNSVSYQYDNAGDLVAFNNQLAEQTSYQYSPGFPHHLIAIRLPDGRLVNQFDYDDSGRLVAACNESGCTTALYDLAGRTQTNIDATGRSVTYVYDDNGNVLSETDALGNTYSFTYDTGGNIIQIVDPLGNVTQQNWDARSNLLSIVEPHEAGADPADFTTTFTHNAQGNLLTTRNPAGGELNHAYNASDLISVSDENGAVLSTFSYDAAGRPLTESDPFGTISLAYGSDGLVNGIADETGILTQFGHDAAGNVTSFTRDGITATMGYDPMGRMSAADFGQGINLDYSYTFGDNWVSAGGSTIPQTERSFSVEGKPGLITRADGSTAAWGYDAAGRLLSETDGVGATTGYGYDAAGRLISETSPLNGVTRFELDAAGRNTAVVNAVNKRTEFTYFPDGRLRQMTDGNSQVWSFDYTPTTASVTDPLSRTTTSTISPHGLLQQVTHPDGTSRSWTYLTTTDYQDASETPTSLTDEAGRVRTYSYDSRGRLASASDLASEVATLSYTDDLLTRVTDAAGQSIDFAYDDFGDFSQVIFADGTGKTLGYDASRRLQAVTLASGANKTLAYDSLDRLISDVRSNGENFAMTWNANDALLSATDSLGITNYEYDLNGDIIRFQGSTGESIDYLRDAVGRVIRKTLSNADGSQSLSTRYEYDAAGSLVRVIDPGGNGTNFSYDAAGRLISKELPNGVTSTYQYDLRDFITSIVHANSAGTVISSVTYDRNVGGEPNRISWQDGSYVTLAYDSGLRIVDEQFFNSSDVLQQRIQYEYDLAGNRTRRIVDGNSSAYGYGAGHRLTSVSGVDTQDYSFDGDGRVAQINRGGGQLDLTYNLDGQLGSVTLGGDAIDYTYDAAGRRIQASDNSSVRRYLMAVPVQGNFEVPQLVVDDSSNIQQTYVYAGDQPLQRIDTSGVQYYLTDAQGSVIGLTDAAGNLTGSVKYDAFGRVQSQTGNMTAPASAGGDFRFHGQWQEAATGFYNLRARDYDPETGRFLSPDPAAPDFHEPESLNRYLFANSNPYVYADPSGRFTLVSVSISINVRSTLTTIATNIVKDYFIDKARSVVGSLVLGALKNYVALRGFNPWDNGASPREAGANFEQEIRELICDRLLPSSLREIVWFEPGVSVAGEATSNGLNCGDGGRRGGRETRPDFMLSKTEPVDLKRRGLKAYLIGEVKLSLKTFYNAYVKRRQIKQFNAIVNFARKRVYARTAVFLALYNGGKKSSLYQRELGLLLSREAVRKGVIPVMVSAF